MNLKYNSSSYIFLLIVLYNFFVNIESIQIYWITNGKKSISTSVFTGLEKYFSMSINKLDLSKLDEVIGKKCHILIFDNIDIKDIDYSVIASVKEKNKSMHTLFAAKEVDEKHAIKIYNKHFDYILMSSYGNAYARAKLRNVLNRKSSKYIFDNIVFNFGELEVNRAEREIKKSDGSIINFTKIEYKITSYLIRNKDRFVPKDELFQKVWGYDEDTTRLLDQYLHRVKKKLDGFAVFVKDKTKGIKISTENN